PAPWVLTTNPADAFITGGLVRFVRAGAYEVSAYAQRSDALAPPRAVASVTVTPVSGGADGAHLLVTLPPLATSGVPAPLTAAIAKDAAGNVISGAPVQFSPDLGVEVFGGTVFAPVRPGVYAVNALVAGTTARALAALVVQSASPDHATATCPATVNAGVPFS